MKRIIVVAITLLVLLANPAAKAFAASSSSDNLTFLEVFLAAVARFLGSSGPVQASESAREELGPARTELLKILNRNELMVRVEMDGASLYLNKDGILEKFESFSKALKGTSAVSEEHKSEILKSLDGARKVLLLDLVDAPQEIVKPAVLEAFDSLESIVFGLEESEAQSILNVLETLEIN